MIVKHDSSVGAHGNVYACFFVVFVSRLHHVDESGSLTSAYALCLTGDANRTAADADFYKVRACFGKKQKALFVDNIARADLYGIAVF